MNHYQYGCEFNRKQHHRAHRAHCGCGSHGWTMTAFIITVLLLAIIFLPS